MKTQTLRRNEIGSIMLEVVAVLALMGVMGAMLFRQIYQRNQELHNIQMASEIRTVKEAFSAYLQANRSEILSKCPTPTCDGTGCDVLSCMAEARQGGTIGNEIYGGVAGYLPDGWFTGAELEDAYKLTVWNYLQDDGSGKRVVYGIVVPTEGTLPSTGWNFKRAARVALLVGADGGAYDKTITNGKIAGALGSWEIQNCDDGGSNCLIDDADYPDGTYVATTGIDIFSPEYEAPEGAVGLPAEWDLALRNLHAYNYFAVGRKDGAEANCYTIQKDGEKRKYNLGENMVYSDTVTGNINNCQPLFWVGSDNGPNGTSGNVYVQNDLNVGADMNGEGNHALKLTAEGVIKQKNGLTIDAAGRIIAKDKVSADIGDLKSGEHFVLDPAYTSTMNDIRLTSRGGVRLSDILPNYILKRIDTLNPAYPSTATSGKIGINSASKSFKVQKATCPTGYKAALVIIPATWNQSLKRDGETVPTYADNDIPVTVNTATGEGTASVESLSIDEGLCISISDENNTSFGQAGGGSHESATTGEGHFWYVRIAQVNDNDKCKDQEMVDTSGIAATAQVFCVWAPSLYDCSSSDTDALCDTKKAQCKAAGYTVTGTTKANTKCTTTRAVDANMEDNSVIGADRSNSYSSETLCQQAGYVWESGKCITTKFLSAADANKITNKSGCIAAGFKWDGSVCSAS